MNRKGLIVVITGAIFLGVFGILNLSPKSPLQTASAQVAFEQGCLSCHKGIATINPRMQPYLLTFAEELYGKVDGYECAVCHQGNPSATKKKEEAHKDLIPNPSNMWVLHQGKGCAQCHSGKGAITTVQGKPLPKPVGGKLFPTTVFSTNPSGWTGRDHIYRMARGLMSLETGKTMKTLSSNGVVPKGTFPYADFDMDDPDGPVPTVGSKAYKEWVSKAIKAGYLKRQPSFKEVPDFEKGVKIFKSEEKAVFGDIYRKQCARCHVWGEGRAKRGDLRAAGCAACHILYGNDGKYEGNDPTIPRAGGTRPYPLKHEITIAIPAAQCTHCHTRGKRIGTTFVGMFEFDYVKDGKGAPPYNERAKPQELLFTKEYMHIQKDVHFERGMDCADCHTSIDVHGDGNLYPVTFYQVEISCYDCHGTPQKYPWELPVGYGTPVTLKGPRGTYKVADKEYLLTSRGNLKGNRWKKGNKAYLLGRYTGKTHEIPLLKKIQKTDKYKTSQGKVAMATIPQHLDKMECYACHSIWAPQCYGCHMRYDRSVKGTDWVTTAKRFNPKTGRQTITKKTGDLNPENRSFMRWESPILGMNLKGKVSPLVPGCQVFLTYVDEVGSIKALNKQYPTSTGHPGPTLAPLQPHGNSLVVRTCEDCHANPKSLGYGTANSRSTFTLQKDKPVFQDLSQGIYGDIPGAKTGRWQVPKIEDFPYTMDQLVTRSGKQVNNMPLVEDRPLNAKQRNLAEREGACIGCHQYYGTPEWERIVKKFGKAETPEDHDKIVAEALKSLFEKAKTMKTPKKAKK